MKSQLGMPGENVEVRVGVEDGHVMADGDRRDQAVGESPDRLAPAPAAAEQGCRHVEVRGVAAEHLAAPEKAAEIAKMSLVTSPGEDLHEHRVGDRDVRPEQPADLLADR